MLEAAVLLAGAVFVAYANGANDNFKGVATLYGCGKASYRTALAWATLTTLAGSLASVFLAATLVEAFSGKGLVPDAVAAEPGFLAAVALGAAGTVFLATVTGLPVSTTHALTGGLAGAGLVAAADAVRLGALGGRFFLPLAASPLLAVALGAGTFGAGRRWLGGKGIAEDTCVCVGARDRLVPLVGSGAATVAAAAPVLDVVVDRAERCTVHGAPGRIARLRVGAVLDAAHFLSAGAVSFARGVNDTPKVVGLLVVLRALDVRVGLAAVALAMAAGAVLQARRVAETVGRRITPMDEEQGLAANLVTSLLVLTASGTGLPVSTTHVSVGSLFGIGLATGRANRRVVRDVIFAWVLTLPLAALLAAGAYAVLR